MNKISRSQKRDYISAIILAAGDGTRFSNLKYPKQFARVLGKPLFIHCLETYMSINEIQRIHLVINPKFKKMFATLLDKYGYLTKVNQILGGVDRQHSITMALDQIAEKGLVVIQNSVSVITTPILISKCIEAARNKDVATAYVPAFHTVFNHSNGRLVESYERQSLGYTCDPLVYRVSVIKKAIRFAERQGLRNRPTLELIQGIGKSIHLIKSDPLNVKVTTKADLEYVREIIKRNRKKNKPKRNKSMF